MCIKLLVKASKTLRLFTQATLSVILSLAAVTAGATSPTEFDVAGNTITFNFPDWYQVQDSTNFNSLCEGNMPCTVPDGEYIVINHTLGERFIISIGGSTPGSVESEVLSFPDDGWYQVQNATTFESICEGLSTCTVDAGRYIVINHTTGVRSETTVPTTGPVTPEITVSELFPEYSDFEINENTITFSAAGWFQVQRLDNYLTVCEGVEECVLAGNGYYQVINFSSDERWTNVFIGQDHSRRQCLLQGGQLIGDPGDGATSRPEYRCASGRPPVFQIFPLLGEPIFEEGEVCCL